MMLTSSVQAVIANMPRICTLVLFIKLHTHIMQVLTIYVLVQELASSDVNSIQGMQGLHVHDICKILLNHSREVTIQANPSQAQSVTAASFAATL